MKMVSVEEMRRLEQLTIELGVPGYELMRRAGEGAAAEIREFMCDRAFKRVVVLAGHGNNGGDALVVAGLLDAPTVVWAAGPLSELRGAAAEAARDLPPHIDVREENLLWPHDFREGDLIIDGLLGTGLSGELRPQCRNWIEAVNASGCPVVALDLPAGVNGDTGEIASVAIQAELTITFGLPKSGLFRGAGPAASGRLRLIDIGLLATEAEKSEGEAFFASDAKKMFTSLAYDAHKNQRGCLLIAAGSVEYSGAAALVSHAALRMGAGVVRLAVPARPFAALPGALIVREVPSTDGCFGRESLPILQKMLQHSNAVTAGSGWGAGKELGEVLCELLKFPGAVLLDADALNTAARHPELWVRREKLIITPHMGEAKKLAEAFGVFPSTSRSEFALALAKKLGAITVLKGARTVVASPDGRVSVNASGSQALATAGSGDVLSGIIGALLAGAPERAFEMACLGVFLHGLSGETYQPGLIADDLPRLAAEAQAALSPFTVILAR